MSNLPEYSGYNAYHETSRNPRVHSLRNRNSYHIHVPENSGSSYLANAVRDQIESEQTLRAAAINNAAYFGRLRAYQERRGRRAAREAANASYLLRAHHRLRNEDMVREQTNERARNAYMFLMEDNLRHHDPDYRRQMGLPTSDEWTPIRLIEETWNDPEARREVTQDYMDRLYSTIETGREPDVELAENVITSLNEQLLADSIDQGTSFEPLPYER